MDRLEPQPPTVREPALAWLRASAGGRAGVPSFFAGPQTAWALEAWLDGGGSLASLEGRSGNGDSIAARALASVHEAALGLARTEARPPTDALRERVLGSVASRAPAGGSIAESATPLSAVVAVGRRHASGPAEVARDAAIARLGADRRGGDVRLERLLERVAELLDFPLLVVSVVHGGETVHRAFRSTLIPAPRVVLREHSYCTHCVAGDAPLVVEDARSDPFFAQHPAVAAFGLVAYCGVPLRVDIGSEREAVVGTLCGYDVRARPILAEDAATLEVFARRAVSIIEQRFDDPSWVDEGSRADSAAERDLGTEVLAPGPFLDLALIALRRVERGGAAALVIGPCIPRIPDGADLADGSFSVVAGRLADGRSGWLLQGRAVEPSALQAGAAGFASAIGRLVAGPIGLSVVGPSDGVVDVEAWVGRAAGG